MANTIAGKGAVGAFSASQQQFRDIVNAAKSRQQAKWGMKYTPKAVTAAAATSVSRPMKTRLAETTTVTRLRGGFYV